VVSWRSVLADLHRTDEPPPRVFAGEHVAAHTEIGPDGEVRAEFVLDDLLAEESNSCRRKVRFTRTVGGVFHNLPVTWSGIDPLTRVVCRRGLRLWTVGADAGSNDQLRIAVTPVSARRVAGVILRRLRIR
jgi:hypothetical protein